jgi:hypothetical protein
MRRYDMDESMRNAMFMSGGNAQRPDGKGRRKGFSSSPLDAWFFYNKVLPIAGKPLQKLGGALIDKFVPQPIKQLGRAILGAGRAIWGDGQQPAADAQQQPLAIEGEREQEHRILEDVQANPNANAEENVIHGQVEEPDDNVARGQENVSANPPQQQQPGAPIPPPSRVDAALDAQQPHPEQQQQQPGVLRRAWSATRPFLAGIGGPTITGLFMGGGPGAIAGGVAGGINMLGAHNRKNNITNLREQASNALTNAAMHGVSSFANNTGESVGNATSGALKNLAPNLASTVGTSVSKGLETTTSNMKKGKNFFSRLGANQIQNIIPSAEEGVKASVNQALTSSAANVGATAKTAVSSAIVSSTQPLISSIANAVSLPLGIVDNVAGGANTLYQGGRNVLSGAYNYLTGRSDQPNGLDNSNVMFSRDSNTQQLNPAGFASNDYRNRGSGHFSNPSNYYTNQPQGSFFSSLFRRGK